MKNLGLAVALGACALLLSAQAGATIVTLWFDPNDLLDLYPSTAGDENVAGETKPTQVDARRLHETWGSPYYETFYNPSAPHTQPDDYNMYLNWRDSLTGTNEGIAMFNTWFLNAGAARTWGETVVNKPDTEVTATTTTGWNYRVIEDPYGLGGASVQWWTTDDDYYVRVGDNAADLGLVSITADLYWDVDADGWDSDDPGVQLGDEIRFWVGNLNGDDAEFYRSDTQALYFDNLGWGTRSPSAGSPFNAYMSTGAGDQGPGFEAAMSATAVPEPLSMVMLGCLGAGMAAARKLRRKKSA